MWGLLWLALLLPYASVGFLFWASSALWSVNCGGARECAYDRGDASFAGWIILVLTVCATVAMVWQAEERRVKAKTAPETERQARARRIAEMERELGIGA